MRQKLRVRFLKWTTGIIMMFFTGALVFHSLVSPVNWEAFMIFLAGVLAACVSYFAFSQTQDIEELSAFQELFASFNQRYNGLNDELNEIYRRCNQNNEILNAEDINILYDYFNLCGEEYYYYKKGYIYPEVWKAWCHGIDYYFMCSKIKDEWMKEEASQAPSYYGLTYQVIQEMVDEYSD